MFKLFSYPIPLLINLLVIRHMGSSVVKPAVDLNKPSLSHAVDYRAVDNTSSYLNEAASGCYKAWRLNSKGLPGKHLIMP